MMNKEEEDRDEITGIEYINENELEVLVCKETGIKSQYDVEMGTWKVGRSGSRPFGISISVSGGGVMIFVETVRPPIFFHPVECGMLVPEGMYFPPETVIDLLPLLDVATRVSLWLKMNPEYPKHSGCILSEPIDGKTH